jgi:hypothetical protein
VAEEIPVCGVANAPLTTHVAPSAPQAGSEHLYPAIWWWESFRQMIVQHRHDASRSLLAAVDDQIARLREPASRG